MDLTVTNNVASGGGGICCGPLIATRVTISNNTATGSAGGGIDALAPVTLTDSTVSGNTSAATGGGIYAQDTTTSLTQRHGQRQHDAQPGWRGRHPGRECWFGNPHQRHGERQHRTGDSGTGGGISVDGSSVLNATRTIVAGNVNGDLSGNGVNGTNTSNLTTGNPLLAPLGAYGGPTATRSPLPGSPAIDAGGTGCTGNDQRLVARPVNGICDIGAVESRAFTMNKVSGDGQSAGAGTAFASPLAVTVNSGSGDPVDSAGRSPSPSSPPWVAPPPPSGPSRVARSPAVTSSPPARSPAALPLPRH